MPPFFFGKVDTKNWAIINIYHYPYIKEDHEGLRLCYMQGKIRWIPFQLPNCTLLPLNFGVLYWNLQPLALEFLRQAVRNVL